MRMPKLLWRRRRLYAWLSACQDGRYRPVSAEGVDIGHWHLSINIEDIEKTRKDAARYGLKELGSLIMVTAGPNKGNKILYLGTQEGIVIELTERHA